MVLLRLCFEEPDVIEETINDHAALLQDRVIFPNFSVSKTRANLIASLQFLEILIGAGLELLVICPGSRSGPLAVAAGILEKSRSIQLLNCIDERSAAFFAIGAARASTKAVALLTTSGTAVANLLPAAVEADKAAIPILFLTADRPSWLKNCGANQTVAQERFLLHVCRWLGQGSSEGLAAMSPDALVTLAKRGWAEAHGIPHGPVHFNLPLDEPLHISELDLQKILYERLFIPNKSVLTVKSLVRPYYSASIPIINPNRSGVIIAGPWRGQSHEYTAFIKSVSRFQDRTGWPLLADPLSGMRGCSELKCISSYDLFIKTLPTKIDVDQIVQLGPMPASRQLQNWLKNNCQYHCLITERDPRPQDLLHSAHQWNGGFARWCDLLPSEFWHGKPTDLNLKMTSVWKEIEKVVQKLLDEELSLMGSIHEPSLARTLEQIIPSDWPIMLASSSPVRDWESFTKNLYPHIVESFRGSSGIDGTLSLAMGLSSVYGNLLLVSGDLALLHDSNGWLWQQQISRLNNHLTVLLIDNGGGGIFEQLPIRSYSDTEGSISSINFERIFTMPQSVDHRLIAAGHGIPTRIVTCLEELRPALEWANNQSVALLHVVTDRFYDAQLRYQIRHKVEHTINNNSSVISA
uniref:Menaquinone biosynthesis protein n=1 Tax=Paulinella chromatophora TaxID=39717 RepID=B1X587_PAUCH|nr:Menaquinone biosynthesis protein [Paulinella chromatophora]ACB43106.1 Menaquinone biosynthesis protein [Paulinella chromatophora]